MWNTEQREREREKSVHDEFRNFKLWNEITWTDKNQSNRSIGVDEKLI